MLSKSVSFIAFDLFEIVLGGEKDMFKIFGGVQDFTGNFRGTAQVYDYIICEQNPNSYLLSFIKLSQHF